MKVYILVDDKNIIRCLASEECNLHKDKLHMKKYHSEIHGTIGDEYNAKNDTWIARPENHSRPPKAQIKKVLIETQRQLDAINKLEEEGIDVADELAEFREKKNRLKELLLDGEPVSH